jgi:hypothetical protein
VEYVVSRGDMPRALLAVAGPVWTRLGIQAWSSMLLIAVAHVRVRWRSIWRVLAMCGVRRTLGSYGRIYRHMAVRLGLLLLGVLMAAPISRRHGRTCW